MAIAPLSPPIPSNDAVNSGESSPAASQPAPIPTQGRAESSRSPAELMTGSYADFDRSIDRLIDDEMQRQMGIPGKANNR
jgi:hypothetical protein